MWTWVLEVLGWSLQLPSMCVMDQVVASPTWRLKCRMVMLELLARAHILNDIEVLGSLWNFWEGLNPSESSSLPKMTSGRSLFCAGDLDVFFPWMPSSALQELRALLCCSCHAVGSYIHASSLCISLAFLSQRNRVEMVEKNICKERSRYLHGHPKPRFQHQNAVYCAGFRFWVPVLSLTPW